MALLTGNNNLLTTAQSELVKRAWINFVIIENKMQYLYLQTNNFLKFTQEKNCSKSLKNTNDHLRSFWQN